MSYVSKRLFKERKERKGWERNEELSKLERIRRQMIEEGTLLGHRTENMETLCLASHRYSSDCIVHIQIQLRNCFQIGRTFYSASAFIRYQKTPLGEMPTVKSQSMILVEITGQKVGTG